MRHEAVRRVFRTVQRHLLREVYLTRLVRALTPDMGLEAEARLKETSVITERTRNAYQGVITMLLEVLRRSRIRASEAQGRVNMTMST